MQTEHQAQQGCLARPIGAEQTQHATRLDSQGHIIQRNLAVLVNLGQLVRFHHQIGGIVGHKGPSAFGTYSAAIIRVGEWGS